MAREQELLLEEFTQFVGLLDGRTDLTVQHAKSWTMDELMDSIHPVRNHGAYHTPSRLGLHLHPDMHPDMYVAGHSVA